MAEIEDIALTLIPRLGHKGIVHLLGIFHSAQRIFAASGDELTAQAALHPDLVEQILRKKSFQAAEREMKYCRRHTITPLASTDADYPALLRETPDYPHVLYVMGQTEVLGKSLLTMVGTRRMTPYGQQAAERLIGDLAARTAGTVIVSGLAFGIDTACHRAALAHGIPTVGVVASVLPEITPAQHTAVAREMIEQGGAIVSELHSQTRQNGRYYLARNRILAGMSTGTVVVESPANGGSLSTALLADSYDRTVMAVPGRLTDTMSSGCNTLIRNRKAQMILSAEDIVRELMWDQTRPDELTVSNPAPPLELTRDEAGLLACFRSDDPLPVEQLVDRTGLSVAELSALLFGLEMAGAIRQLPGNRYIRVHNNR